MSITLFAQPYDISATGFYFETPEQYDEFSAKTRNDFSQPVEEFEIQFIDGDDIDSELAQAWELNQGNFTEFLDAAEDWDEDQKRHYIIAVSECGYAHDEAVEEPEIDIYYVDGLRELAEQFIDDGLYGPIPKTLQYYIDYDAIARDLAMDYSETVIAGERLIYACR